MSEKKTARKYSVRYVNEWVQKAIAGAKYAGQFARPFILDIRYFMIDTKEDGTVINSYVLFGGVPTKKVHDKLESLGFAARRRPAEWTDKNKNVHTVDGNDNECYAVYYYLDVPTQEQLDFLASLTIKGLSFCKEKGKSFLLTSFEQIDANWGERDEWLSVFTVVDEDDDDADDDDDDDAVIEEEDDFDM